MLGLAIIVLAVALALAALIRTNNRLAALRRRADEDDGARAEYNAALHRFPASLVARPLGFQER